MWDWMGEWVMDTPQTVMTTRAPAVLIKDVTNAKKILVCLKMQKANRIGDEKCLGGLSGRRHLASFV